jgi:hypothetical protein
MKAELTLHERFAFPDGAVVEMKVYQVPKSKFTPHGFKYSLVYIKNRQRLIGYDNHEQQGDHRHYRGQIEPYVFTTVDRLLDDFRRDLRSIKGEEGDEGTQS